jgi:hypothetical protein
MDIREQSCVDFFPCSSRSPLGNIWKCDSFGNEKTAAALHSFDADNLVKGSRESHRVKLTVAFSLNKNLRRILKIIYG